MIFGYLFSVVNCVYQETELIALSLSVNLVLMVGNTRIGIILDLNSSSGHFRMLPCICLCYEFDVVHYYLKFFDFWWPHY